MATVTDKTKTTRSLVSRPQRLGILPTWWFWNNPDNWRLARWYVGPVAFIIIFSLGFLNLGYVGAGVVAAGSMVVMVGVLERYIRHQVKKRGAAALGPSRSDGSGRRAIADGSKADPD